jgi:hypothetical protein
MTGLLTDPLRNGSTKSTSCHLSSCRTVVLAFGKSLAPYGLLRCTAALIEL